MNETTHEARPAGTRDGISLGTVVFGLILLAIGVLWLLDVAELVSVTWTLVGSIMLIAVGIGLIVGARQGSHGGLIFLGIALTIVVTLGSIADWPELEASVGDQVVTPQSFESVEDTYSWGVGSQTVDLRQVEFPEGETEVSFQLGMGDLTVYVPEDIAVRAEWQGGVGDAEVLGTERSGFGLDGTYETDDFEDQSTRLVLDLQVGVGAIEVVR